MVQSKKKWSKTRFKHKTRQTREGRMGKQELTERISIKVFRYRVRRYKYPKVTILNEIGQPCCSIRRSKFHITYLLNSNNKSIREGREVYFQKSAMRHLAAVRMCISSFWDFLGTVPDVTFKRNSLGSNWNWMPSTSYSKDLTLFQKGWITGHSQNIWNRVPLPEPHLQHTLGISGFSLWSSEGVWYHNIINLYWFSLKMVHKEVLAARFHITCHVSKGSVLLR